MGLSPSTRRYFHARIWRQGPATIHPILSLEKNHSPHAHVDPSYGTIFQYNALPDTSPHLFPKETTTIQESIGTLLYYD